MCAIVVTKTLYKIAFCLCENKEDKGKNKEYEQKICSITARELINEEHFENNKIKSMLRGCPYINVKIHDELYEMLVDSRAEVSAISILY